MADTLGSLFVLGGAFFFVAGTVGLLRFPDVYTRLHAVTKADNLGLGLLVLGLLVRAEDGWIAMKLIAIWAFAVAASATNSQLVARAVDREGVKPWTAP